MKLKVGQVWVDADGYTREITKLVGNFVDFKTSLGNEFFTTVDGFGKLFKESRLSKKDIINEFFNGD